MDPRLSSLLERLFSSRANDLRNWLFGIDPEILKFLRQDGSLASLYDDAAEELLRRGHVDAALFQDLVRRFPKREKDIRTTAGAMGFVVAPLIDHTGDAVVIPDEPPVPVRDHRTAPTVDRPDPARRQDRRPSPVDRPVAPQEPKHTASASDGLRRTLLILTVGASLSAFSLAIAASELESHPRGIETIPKYSILALLVAPGLAYSLALRMVLADSAPSTRPLWLVWPLWLLVSILAVFPFGIELGSLLGAWIVHRLASRACGHRGDPRTRTWLLLAAAVTALPAQAAYFNSPSVPFTAAATLSLVLWQFSVGIALWSGLRASPPTR